MLDFKVKLGEEEVPSALLWGKPLGFLKVGKVLVVTPEGDFMW